MPVPYLLSPKKGQGRLLLKRRSVQRERSCGDLSRRLVRADHGPTGGDLAVDELQPEGIAPSENRRFSRPDDEGRPGRLDGDGAGGGVSALPTSYPSPLNRRQEMWPQACQPRSTQPVDRLRASGPRHSMRSDSTSCRSSPLGLPAMSRGSTPRRPRVEGHRRRGSTAGSNRLTPDGTGPPTENAVQLWNSEWRQSEDSMVGGTCSRICSSLASDRHGSA